MKKLPIKQKVVEKKAPPARKQARGRKPDLDELKALSNAEMLNLCQTLGLSIPHYEEGTKDYVVHMHLLHLLKLHYGYSENKPRNAGRRPSLPTTLAIHESNAELKKITAKLDRVLGLLEKLLK